MIIKAMIAMAIIFWAIPAHAGYQLDYDLNLGAIKIGYIRLSHFSNIIKARVNITAGGLLSFQQDVKCLLPAGQHYLTEESIIKSRTRSHQRKIIFSPSQVRSIEMNRQKTNTLLFTDQRVKFTVLSFIHTLLRGELKDKTSYPLFLRHRFVEMSLNFMSTNQFSIMDREKNYLIKVQYKKDGKYRIPELIDFKRYRMFNINWHVFNCTLKSYRVDKK